MEIRSFQEIIGHEDAVEYLRGVVAKGTAGHAYIFTGEAGSGKRTLASLFAMALECETRREKGGAEPCGRCTSCRKAISTNHPDILYAVHAKPQVITVDEIREQVVQTAEIKPYESPYKIYVIADADRMNPQAQNALLKTIEEPPAYVVVILLAVNEEALLPTIRSRCVTVRLRPAKEEQIREHLIRELHVQEQEAGIIASFSQGNIGKARACAAGDAFSEMLASSVDILAHLREMGPEECIARVSFLTKDKQNIYDYLDIFTLWFRDVLLFKATRDVDALVFRSRIEEISEQARQSSYEGIEKILSAIGNAKTRLRANVNFELTMELLFLTMTEN